MNSTCTSIISMLVMLMMSSVVVAQSFTLKGRVTDEDGNALEFATVACPRQAKVTMTDLKGEFNMKLQTADSVEIRFSMIGYKTRTRTLRNPRTTQTLQIQMSPMQELSEVVITERRRQTTQMQEIDAKELKATPSATGNAVEELIQQQAGVSTHNELSSQYNVRGGSFDENSVYINNIEIYRPLLIRSGQQEGLSVINPDMVEKIGFSSGGFSAKYGDKMSSALDITYKRPKAFEATAMASLLGASAYVGMSNKKFSMSHGLRYKTNRYLLGTLETTGEYRPNQLDYQSYMTYNPNKRWSFDLLGNISENHYNFKPHDRETSFGTMQSAKSFKVYFDGQEKDIFRTLFGAASVTRHISDSLSIKLLWSAFHTKEQEAYDIQGQYWLNDAQSAEQLGVGTYAEHARNYLTANVQSVKLMVNRKLKQHEIEGGLVIKWEHLKEQSREYEMRDSSGYSIPHTSNRLDLIYTLSSKNDMHSTRIEGYVQDVFRWHNGNNFFTLNYGIRFANWSFNKETLVSPRASLALVPASNPDITYRLATGIYYQAPFYKEFRDTTAVGGITKVTLNKHIKSQRSFQMIGAMDYRFKMKDLPYKFSAEIYYKALANLIPYNVQNVKTTYYGQNMCSGYAAGLDLKLYGEFVPGTDSWVSLSLMRTQQKMNGQWIPMPTDQRYALNLHFTDYFPGTTRWKMTLKLAYADGLPFGAPHRGITTQSFRAPAYKRADIGMSYLAYQPSESETKKFGIKRIWLGVDCLNLFGISNVNSYYWVTDVTNRQWAVPNYLTGRQINGKIIVEL
ncbi:TonB-dependent receptor [Prevotella sp. E13-17]|uniref:TonB-dependent receptor n=1 Tax=Prevotella sp. E13-17 TaxID=2913616 RepID=UPI001EDBEB4D|nr:TonB-dependent receptor [Prevotella sp. E13-17]UKK50166.1 TonB-dependent receptor [Prevotella sp. E13-17]